MILFFFFKVNMGQDFDDDYDIIALDGNACSM